VSLGALDIILAREIGELCWYMVPRTKGEENFDEKILGDEAFRGFWEPETSSELADIMRSDPVVEYPAVILDVSHGRGPFVFPPKIGKGLRLSEYTRALRHFLIFQITAEERLVRGHILDIVRTAGRKLGEQELLRFVDQLWRGRWIMDSFSWGEMRTAVITGGGKAEIEQLYRDTERLASEAARVVATERRLKGDARSMDEWLFEAYCLLPEIATWFANTRRANDVVYNDEIEK
jgi:hypothetical protein